MVEVFVEDEGTLTVSPTHSAWLEVWTDDGSLPMSANPQQPVGSVDEKLGQIHPSNQQSSPVKSGKDRYKRDLIIGKPGMLKLGLGIDARSGHICIVKRKMRKKCTCSLWFRFLK